MKAFWLGTITAICLLLGSTAYAGDRHRHHDHGHRDRYERRHDHHHHHHHHYRQQGRYYYGPAPRYYHPGYYRPAPRYYGPAHHDRYYRDGVGGHITVNF